MSKIFIAGHKGLVGSALIRRLSSNKEHIIITKNRDELDLLSKEAVETFFEANKPDWVFLAAAKVGGILANKTYPVEFLLENLTIQNNIIETSYKAKVKKLLFLGSSCIYPKFAEQPIKEEYLLTSVLEESNEAYAIAKIAGIKLCNAYNKEYNTNFICVMPTNLYGPNDNYHKDNAHALPMLLRRFHEAKLKDDKSVEIWGTGTPKREFLYSDDLADACIFLMENINAKDIVSHINIGTGEDLSILELANLIKEVVDYKGKITLNTNKPDGTPRKLLDVNKLKQLGWTYKIPLKKGIELTYQDYLSNPNLRK